MIYPFAFILTIGILIIVHEYGHYRVAVACGVKVDRFSLGFGKVIWRRQPTPGGTEFVISALPLGGYVRWIDDREGGVLPSEGNQTFKSKPLAQRAAIVAAGPMSNLLLAVLLYSAANWLGIEEPKALLSTPTPGSIAERAGVHAGELVRAASRDGNEWHDVRSTSDLAWDLAQAVSRGESLYLMVANENGRGERSVTLALDQLPSKELDTAVMRSIGLGGPFSEPIFGKPGLGGPGDKAGLLAGDRVLSINGRIVSDAAGVLNLIRANGAHGEPSPMVLRVERGGRTLELTAQPAVRKHGEQRVGYIDVPIGKPGPKVFVQYGFLEGLSHGLTRTWEMSTLTLKLLGKMLIFQASLKNLSGPLTIAEYAGQSMQMGLTFFLSFMAIVSVSLGVLNLLPLPVLDGGHLMYYLFEAVTGRPLSEQWLGRLQRAGLVLVLLMMSLALYNDVARHLGLH